MHTISTSDDDDMEIPEEAYRAIEREISSDQSPVGIDAKRTHVIILHRLERIEARLAEIEAALNRSAPDRPRS